MVLYNSVLFLLVEIILFKMSAKVFYGYREIEPKWSSYDDIFNKSNWRIRFGADTPLWFFMNHKLWWIDIGSSAQKSHGLMVLPARKQNFDRKKISWSPQFLSGRWYSFKLALDYYWIDGFLILKLLPEILIDQKV